MNVFIDKEKVMNLLDKNNVRFVDCRFNLSDPDEGEKLYKEKHIPGAVYFHLERDLSAPVSEHGGRHPLPDLQSFTKLLEQAGIRNDTTVIAYDGGEGAFAARCWWLLAWAGHKKAFILDGGFKAWTEAGYPADNRLPNYPPASFEAAPQAQMLATMEDVRKAIAEQDHILIDSRGTERFLGITEPIDKKAGHIPTARNFVWTDCFTGGKFKSPSEQENRFKELDRNKPVIVYCGSGITATPNYIALKAAGFKKVKLYAGSFSDWISYDENEVISRENQES